MKYITPAVMYAGFFGVVGFAVYYTKTATPLWCMLLIPSWSSDANSTDAS